eukprot:COSAG02_NODE_37384_length_442_cov_1.349854_1_plen_46_part_10
MHYQGSEYHICVGGQQYGISGCYAFGITSEKVSLDGLPDTAICTER